LFNARLLAENGQNSSHHGESYERIANDFGLVCNVVSVSTEQIFSQNFEAISAASNLALNNTRFTEN
jgi:hypothetical protein